MTIKKQDYLEGTSVQLELWGRAFSRIDDELAESDDAAPEVFRKRLAALKRHKRHLERELLEAAHTTRVDWKDVSKELESAVRDFRTLAIQVYDQSRKRSA